jgi:hypothetical protein
MDTLTEIKDLAQVAEINKAILDAAIWFVIADPGKEAYEDYAVLEKAVGELFRQRQEDVRKNGAVVSADEICRQIYGDNWRGEALK